MNISEEKTVAEVVTENIKTAHIFKKHGIDFCCGGGITIEKACAKNGVDYAILGKELEEIDEYDGFPVGKLAKSMLLPKYEQLDQAVDKADIKTAQHKLDELIETCNQCHQTTEHGYVVIQRNSSNVYLQDFTAR